MGLLKKISLSFTALILLWGIGLALFMATIENTSPIPTKKADAILVLTGGKNRITKGLHLFASGLSKQLFISGVHPDTKLRDIKKIWKAKLPACCITLGHEATTTTQNAEEIQKWLADKDYETFILITSHYHMPRALIELENIGIKKSQITRYAFKQDDFTLSRKYHIYLILSEYHKTIFRWLQIKTGVKIPQ